MSVKVMGKVWDSTLPPNQRLVLLAYADAAEHDGTSIYPGWQRIVEMTGYSRSQVSRLTDELLDLGVLTQVRRGQTGQRAEYSIDLEWFERVSQDATQSAEPLEATVSHPATQSEADSVAPMHREGRAHATPPVLDPSSKSDLLPSVVDHSRPRDEVWDALVEVFGAPTTESNRTLRGRICRSLKSAGATGPEVVRRAQAWQFHFGGSADLTETALEKHWDRLGRPPLRPNPTVLSQAEEDARQAERELRAAELDRARLGA